MCLFLYFLFSKRQETNLDAFGRDAATFRGTPGVCKRYTKVFIRSYQILWSPEHVF